MSQKIIAYQGEPGANSHMACMDVYPDWQPLPCETFEDALGAIQDGSAQLGVSIVRPQEHEGSDHVLHSTVKVAARDVKLQKNGQARSRGRV